MKNNRIQDGFEVLGKYYIVNEVVCREVLHIKRKSNIETIRTPDLLVIMMNPGSSRPNYLNSYLEVKQEDCLDFVLAKPDDTQNQIMEVMGDKYHFACVLNLIDKCETKSTKLKSSDKQFSKFRNKIDGIKFIEKYAPLAKSLVIAWGCKSIFKPLIKNVKTAIAEIKFDNIYSYPKNEDTENLYYYHPLPPNTTKQKEWVDKIVSQIR